VSLRLKHGGLDKVVDGDALRLSVGPVGGDLLAG